MILFFKFVFCFYKSFTIYVLCTNYNRTSKYLFYIWKINIIINNNNSDNDNNNDDYNNKNYN